MMKKNGKKMIPTKTRQVNQLDRNSVLDLATHLEDLYLQDSRYRMAKGAFVDMALAVLDDGLLTPAQMRWHLQKRILSAKKKSGSF